MPTIYSNCRTPYCTDPATVGMYCKECKKQVAKAQKEARLDNNPDIKARRLFYQSTAWRKLSRDFLRNNPLCQMCKQRAQHVDHVVPLAQGGAKLDRTNLQSLCVPCHSKKTQKEQEYRMLKGGK